MLGGRAAVQPSPLSANSISLGYVYSFNGPHSLFVDTMRTVRILGVPGSLAISSCTRMTVPRTCLNARCCTG